MTIAEREANAEIRAAQELEEAARFLDLEPWIAQRLHHPEKELHFNLQTRTDNGEPVILHAMRVQHASVRGPCMGPVMFAKAQGITDVRARAMQQTWQWALWGMPLGGSAGLVNAEVGEFPERELRDVIRAFVNAVGGAIGPAQDVLTPSRGLPPQVMAWALSALGGSDRNSFGAITGKPASLQGVNRELVAAIFLKELAREVLRERGTDLSGRQVMIVGFDKYAQAVASQLQTAGARVIAVADSSAAIYSRAGLNISMLAQHIAKEGVTYGYTEAEQVAFDEMVRIPSDVLVLADGEELQISPAADVVIEAAGTAGESAAEKSFVLPEMVSGFGLSFADYLEWRKAAWGLCAEFDIPRAIRSVVRKTWREISEYARLHEVTLRTAATTLAIGRVAEAMRAL